MGSIDAAMRTEEQLEGSQLRFLSGTQAMIDACQSLGIQELEVRGSSDSCMNCAAVLWKAGSSDINESSSSALP